MEKLEEAINLEELDLSSNVIEALSREAFQNMYKLQRINLARNRIKSMGVLCSLTTLQVLDLEVNQIATIPQSIKSLKQLR